MFAIISECCHVPGDFSAIWRSSGFERSSRCTSLPCVISPTSSWYSGISGTASAVATAGPIMHATHAERSGCSSSANGK
jgi:hypothetical protein